MRYVVVYARGFVFFWGGGCYERCPCLLANTWEGNVRNEKTKLNNFLMTHLRNLNACFEQCLGSSGLNLIIRWRVCCLHNFFSASELINQSRKESSLPNIGGIKYYAPDGSEEQHDSLETSLSEYYKLLKEERICKK